MPRTTLLSIVALFLVGADGLDEVPVPVEDASTAPTKDGPTDGQHSLEEATEHLQQRRWSDALTLSIAGISAYPEQAASFEAIATIAADQISRGPQFSSPGANGAERPPAIRPDSPEPSTPGSRAGTAEIRSPYDSWRSTRRRGDTRPHPAADDSRHGILFGFDAGLYSGVRVEWKAKGRTVDGVGFKAGLGTWIYPGSGLFLTPITQLYMDLQNRTDFQFETSLGIMWTSGGSIYPLIGIGAQWDPPRPIQVNAGMGISATGLFPDVSVGFLW